MMIYVGCADDVTKDQVLEEFIIKKCKKGQQKVSVEVKSPDASKIATEDLLGVTVMMLTVFYRRQEFFRCSYFVYNGEDEKNQIVRSILIDEPRIKVQEILWSYLGD